MVDFSFLTLAVTALRIGIGAVIAPLTAAASGWACLRLIGIPAQRRLDTWLAALLIGHSYLYLTISALGLVGLYTRASLVVIVMAPWVAVRLRRVGSKRSEAIAAVTSADSRQRMLSIAVGLWVVGTVAYWFLICGTSPVDLGDAMVSWDKWAVDWASGRSMFWYTFGGYGQLLPIVTSLPYVLAGTWNIVLPPEHFAAHATHVVYVGIGLLSLWRCATVLGIPGWLGVAALVIWPGVVQTVLAGTAETLLVGLGGTLLAVCLRLATERRDPTWTDQTVLAAGITSVCAAKINGAFLVLACLLILLFAPWGPIVQNSARKRVALCFFAGLVPLFLFLGQQTYVARRIEVETIDIRSHMFRTASFPRGLQDHVASIDPERSIKEGLRRTRLWLRGVGDASLPIWSIVATVAVAGLALGVPSRLGSLLALTSVGYLFVYLRTASYDLRNVSILFPMTSVILAIGWSRVLAIRPREVGDTAAVFLVVMTFVAMTWAATRNPISTTWRLSSAIQRLNWIVNLTGPARSAAFFPQYSDDIGLLQVVGAFENDTNVLVMSPMYRLIENGVWPQKIFSWSKTKPGDWLLAGSGFGPPADQKWFPLKGAPNRLWVRFHETDAVLPEQFIATGVNPPEFTAGDFGKTSVRFRGEQSYFAYLPSVQEISTASGFVWCFEVDGVVDAVMPVYYSRREAEHWVGIDETHSYTARTGLTPSQPTAFCGVTTLDPARRSELKNGELFFGLLSHTPGVEVQVRSAWVRQRPLNAKSVN